jgi:membrane-associated phospholipid phosphatase
VSWLVTLDRSLVTAVNGLAGRSPAFDALVLAVAANHLVKGGLLMALVWWAWFCPAPRAEALARRKTIVTTFAAAALALVVSALVQHVSPMRPRPIHDPTLFLRTPIGLPSDVMTNWSSFPSDHATLFYALATGLLFASRGLGIAAYAYVTLVIVLPRLYVGWHYPSDIVAGWLIGVSFACLAKPATVQDHVARPVLGWARRHPQAFYAGFFLLSYQIATLMEDGRALASVLLRVLRGTA